jgi:hypothetical protein
VLLSNLVVQRQMDLAWSFAQLHPTQLRTIVVSHMDICDYPLNWSI